MLYAALVGGTLLNTALVLLFLRAVFGAASPGDEDEKLAGELIQAARKLDLRAASEFKRGCGASAVMYQSSADALRERSKLFGRHDLESLVFPPGR